MNSKIIAVVISAVLIVGGFVFISLKKTSQNMDANQNNEIQVGSENQQDPNATANNAQSTAQPSAEQVQNIQPAQTQQVTAETTTEQKQTESVAQQPATATTQVESSAKAQASALNNQAQETKASTEVKKDNSKDQTKASKPNSKDAKKDKKSNNK